MKNLVSIKRGDIFTNTLEIANALGRNHDSVTKHIKRYKADFEDIGPVYSFRTASPETTGGRPCIVFELDETQATFLIALMGNSRKVVDFKKALAIQFVAMRKLLLEKQTQEWIETRQHSKKVRLQETDAIKTLVSYAKTQGSKHAGMLYMTYSKLVKKLAGYETRDTASAEVLTLVITMERILNGIIQTEMELNTHYKEIYVIAKAQLQAIRDLWLAPQLVA